MSLIKIMLIGDCGVGKTAVRFAFTEKKYIPDYVPTIGLDFSTAAIVLQGQKIKLQIWDMSGDELYKDINTSHYRNAMGIMLVYDTTNANTFKNLEHWLRLVTEYALEETFLIIVGNKCDLEHLRQVRKDQGRELASSFGMKFMEVSAKERISINQAFFTLTEDILEKQTNEKRSTVNKSKSSNDSEGGKHKNIFKRLFQPFFSEKKQATKEGYSSAVSTKIYPHASGDVKQKALAPGFTVEDYSNANCSLTRSRINRISAENSECNEDNIRLPGIDLSTDSPLNVDLVHVPEDTEDKLRHVSLVELPEDFGEQTGANVQNNDLLDIQEDIDEQSKVYPQNDDLLNNQEYFVIQSEANPENDDVLDIQEDFHEQAEAVPCRTPTLFNWPRIPECDICKDHYCDSFLPCGHLLCFVCACELEERGKRCHICREPFLEIQKLYY